MIIDINFKKIKNKTIKTVIIKILKIIRSIKNKTLKLKYTKNIKSVRINK